MARPNQEAIETFMSITGESEAVAVRKLEEHGGDLNEAVNAHFSEGDRNIARERPTTVSQDDDMDVDQPIQAGSRRPPFPFLPSAMNLNPYSLLDPDFNRSIFDGSPGFTSRKPFVSHPREVREVPIEGKDGSEQSSGSGLVPTIEDVTGTEHAHGPETQGTVIIDDEDDEDNPTALPGHTSVQKEQKNDVLGDSSLASYPKPSAPRIDDLPDYRDDIEEEMVQAAIEASKREVGEAYSGEQFGPQYGLGNSGTQERQSHLENADLSQAVSLSLKTAEQEKALREQGEKIGTSEPEDYKSSDLGDMVLPSSNGRQSRLNVGSSSIQDEAEDAEEQPLVRHRSRHVSSSSIDAAKGIEEVEVTPPSSPHQSTDVTQPPRNGNDFHSDEWGGISSEEHDEAIMLEAAMFGGIPEGSGYHFPYAPHQFMQNGLDRTSGMYPRWTPRPPSPGLAAQRLIREQQDDEYLASLQADREKELKAMEEAEARRLEEQAAREAALEEERRKEEESRRKLEEEQEIERQLAAKEASLPKEPTADDENAVTLLVRMPDGTRHGRRFLKSNKLQSLFDFIDVARGVKPGTYRVVRPFPRRAFSDGESTLTLSELGLTSKQEALFLELI
ncbi:hypothetical protein NMG60_11027162 [Bertholletia excelsa]